MKVISVSGQMRLVLVALVPGIAAAAAVLGPRVLVPLAVALVTAAAAEYAVLTLRGERPREALVDGSVCVLAVLLGLAIPPYAHPALAAVGAVVAVLLGKHAFGGLGGNLFNPAMVGYAFLLVCFPVEMSRWLETAAVSGGVDAVSGATLLDYARTQFSLEVLRSEFPPGAPFGHVGAARFEWMAVGFGLGGLWLLVRGVVAWRIPCATLAGFLAVATVYYVIDSSRALTPLEHLFSGSIVLCAFFIATDPVSSPVTPRAQLLFGLGVGMLVYLIRVHGAFPDGVAFAVLMMNLSAAWLDGIAQPYSRGIEP